jgi:hypothetical protein
VKLGLRSLAESGRRKPASLPIQWKSTPKSGWGPIFSISHLQPRCGLIFFLNQDVAGDCANAGGAGERHGHPHFRHHQLQHVPDACLTAARQCIVASSTKRQRHDDGVSSAPARLPHRCNADHCDGALGRWWGNDALAAYRATGWRVRKAQERKAVTFGAGIV